MNSVSRRLVVGAFALLICIPAAFAQTPEASTLPVNEPLEVGGTILQPGTYLIRVLPSFKDRNKIQITSTDRKTLYATVLTIPHPLRANEKVPNTTFVFYPAAEGAPRALRTWFARNPDVSQGGHDIVYEETRAKQLARLNQSPVVSYRGETQVADLDTTELRVVTPQATVETYTPPAPEPMTSAANETLAPSPAPVVAESQPAPVAENQPIEMPNTASTVPLIGLLGLLSVGGAVAFRLTRPE